MQWYKWIWFVFHIITITTTPAINIYNLVADGNSQLTMTAAATKTLQVQTNGTMMTSMTTIQATTTTTTTAQQMLVIDARSYTSAWANKYKGGGFESTGEQSIIIFNK
jgi:hypothetical protein